MSKRISDVIHWEAPIVNILHALRKEPIVPVSDSAAIFEAKRARYEDACTKCKEDGFDTGAVVAFRYKHLAPAVAPANWGVVVMLIRYADDESKYKPIKVQWGITGRPDSYHEIHELYLIHPALEEETIKLMLQAQEEELRDTCC